MNANVPSGVEEKLDRPGVGVAGGARRRDGGRAQARAQRAVDRRRGRLLDDFLVAALDRALALAEVHDVPVRVAEDLHFDVSRVREVALEQHAGVAEGGRRLAPRRGQRRVETGEVGDHAHPATAAAGAGLDDQRHPEPRGFARAASSSVWSSPS